MRKVLVAVAMALVLAMGIGQVPAFAGPVLTWPVPASHTITQGYHDNKAIDIGGKKGTTIVAAYGGTVKYVFKCTKTHRNSGDCHGFGTGVVILGDDGRTYQYAHMQAGSIPSNVSPGKRVKAGQKLGCMGMTGNAGGVHLHFGISNGKYYWLSGPNPAKENYGSTVSLSIGSLSASNVKRTNAKLSATVTKLPGMKAKTCGIYLGTAANKMTKRNTETVSSAANAARGGKSFNIYYDLTKELKITLKPGTKYYYKFYVVYNGKEYQSKVATFTTAR